MPIGALSESSESFNASDFMDWQDLGIAFFEEGNYTEAIRCYSTAISLEPRDAYAMSYKGVALSELGKYNDAIKSFEEAINLDPENVVFWANKGNSLYDQGNYTEAIKCFEEAIKLDATYEAAWIGKGLALNALGKPEEASKNYQDNIEALDDALQAQLIDNIDYQIKNSEKQEIQGGHNINLTPDPETVSIGPYAVSFDLGTINHTVEVYEGKKKPSYVVKIFLPNDCWNNCEGTNGNIRIKIDYYPLDKPPVWNSGPNWTQVKRPMKIDGLPGWIAEANVSSGVSIHAEYSLDSRGNTADGNVSIDALSAFRRYYDGSGFRGNSTIPNIMRLIDTLHIEKTSITETTYKKVPLYLEIPENTYITE